MIMQIFLKKFYIFFFSEILTQKVIQLNRENQIKFDFLHSLQRNTIYAEETCSKY
jgi:hypothetical protein